MVNLNPTERRLLRECVIIKQVSDLHRETEHERRMAWLDRVAVECPRKEDDDG